MNLVGNAIKYTPDQSKVWITLEKHDTEITVSVNDNGEGLASEELGMIFDAFYQVSKKANSPVKGTGLGLAICQGIVEAHNGRIWAESEPGRGASFKFALPARETRNEH